MIDLVYKRIIETKNWEKYYIYIYIFFKIFILNNFEISKCMKKIEKRCDEKRYISKEGLFSMNWKAFKRMICFSNTSDKKINITLRKYGWVGV